MKVFKKYAIYYFVGFLLTFISWISILVYIILNGITAFVSINLIIVTFCMIFFIICSIYYKIKSKDTND